MKSLTIEFFRHASNATGVLREGERYILAVGRDRPTREISLPKTLDVEALEPKLLALGYEAGAKARKDAVDELGTVVSGFLSVDWLAEIGADSMLHVDLVTNPAEVAMLPFELLKDANGKPLLVRKEVPKDGPLVELTRSVRADSDGAKAPASAPWPARPRVLFAWASPLSEVPFAEHKEALRKALDPWVPAFSSVAEPKALDEVLTVLDTAALGDIKKACDHAKTKGKPFTHVHLLAHGTPLDQQRFGLALHDEEDGDRMKAASPEELEDALKPLRDNSVVVTLAVCDAANMQNSRIPQKSVAHKLHVSGFPVVVASQLPLTTGGSTKLVSTFYTALLEGRDVREAVHEARLALYGDGTSPDPDWASLVVYVRLPQRYEEYLAEVRLRSACLSLHTTRNLSDRLSNEENPDPELLRDVERRLEADIERLKRYGKDPRAASKDVQETFGLLGSAEKRLAEHYHSLGRDWEARSRSALERSSDWYRKGEIEAHWLGVQALSLEAILKGSIADQGAWYVAKASAEKACQKNSEEIWAWGSLAELWLLAPKVEGVKGADAAKARALECLEKLKERVGSGDPYPIVSTRLQLERYVGWWTNANKYFPDGSDLSAVAKDLLEALPKPGSRAS